MPEALIILLLAGAAALLAWVFVVLRVRPRQTPTGLDEPLHYAAQWVKHGDALLVASEHGRLLHLNETAQAWLSVENGAPNLEHLAALAQPSDTFLELFANESHVQLQIAGRWVEATSHRIPAGAEARTIVVLRPLTQQSASTERYDLSRALNIVNAVGSTIDATLSIEQVLQALLSITLKEIEADAGEICLVDPSSGLLMPRGWIGDASYVIALAEVGGGYKVGEGITGWIAKHRKPILVSDCRAPAALRPALPHQAYLGFVGVPLLLGDRLIGTFELASVQAGVFTPAHLALLSAVASSYVTAIRNTELYAEQIRRMEDLAALPSIALRLSEDATEVYQVLAERIARLMDVEIAGVLLADQRQSVLVAQEPFYGLPSQIVRSYRIPLLPNTPQISIYRDSDAWSSADLADEPLAEPMNLSILTNAAGVRDLLWVPLQIGSRRIGLLQVSNRRSAGGFTRRDEQTLRLLAAQTAVIVEELRLYEQDALRQSELMSLQEMTQAFGALAHGGDVYVNTNAQVAKLMGVEKCGILLFDETGQRLIPQLPIFGLEDELARFYQIPLEPNGVIWHMWQSQDYWYTNHVAIDPIVVGAGLADLAQMAGVTQTLIVPLSSGGRRFGVLQVSNKQTGEAFTDKDARLLTIFGAQVAAVLDNARLFQEAQRRATEAEKMRTIAEQAGKVLTVDDSFAPVLKTVAELMDSTFAFLNVIDPQSGALVAYPRNIYGSYPLSEPYVLPVFNPGYEQSVFIAQRTFISNDILHDKRVLPAYRVMAEKSRLHRAAMVPLAVGKTSLGELGVANAERPYTEEDIRLLQTIAPQLAAALDRLRLYDATGQNLSRRQRELDAISRVTTELAQTLELESVLSVLRSEVLRVTEANGVTVALLDTEDAPLAELRLSRREGDLTLDFLAEIERQAALIGGDPVLVEDYADSTYPPQPTQARSAAAAAFTYEDRVVGVIHVYSDQAHRFDAQAAHFVATMATKAAISYGSYLRYQESSERSTRLRRRVEQLNQIFEIGQIFQQNASDRAILLEAIAYSIQQSVGYDIVLIALVDESDGLLKRVAQAGMPVDAFTRSQDLMISAGELEASLKPAYLISESYFLPFERLSDWGFSGLAALGITYDGKRTLHPRGRNDWRDGDMLLIPLRGVQGNLLGVMSLDRPFDGKRPDRSTLEILEIFAHQATTTLENQRVFSESARSAEQQARLNEVIEAIARTLDLTEIVQAVASGVQKLARYQRMTFAIYEPDQSSFQVIRLQVTGAQQFNVTRERRPDLARTALNQVYDEWKDLLIGAHEPLQATFDDVRAWRAEGERTTLIVPLITGGLSLGALHIGADDDLTALYDSVRPLLRRISNLAAVAMQNARLFNQAINLRLFNESVVESIQQGIVVLDNSGLIVTVNDFMKRTHRWSDYGIRQDLFAYRPTLKPILGDAVRTVLETAEPQELIEQTIYDGAQSRIENFYLYPLLAADSVRGVVILVDDITERYRLERDIESRTEQLAALTEASRQLASTLERDAVIKTMFDALRRVIDYDVMTLWTHTDDELVLEAARGDERLPHATTLRIADVPALQTLIESQNAYALTDEMGQLPGGISGRSWLGVPMLQQGRVTGVLMLGKAEPGYYDAQAEQAGLAFANQVAVSLQNATLFNETSEQMERLSLINRVSMQLAQSLDTENILEISLRELATLLGGAKGRAYIFEREIGLARAVVDYPRGEEPPTEIIGLKERAALRHAFSSSAPLIIPDVSALPHNHPLYTETHASGMSGYMLIPLQVGGQTAGMFEIECYGPTRPIEAAKIDMALLIANQSSIAVLNANLLEQTMVRTRELETLLEAAQATSFTLDLEEVLQSVVRLTVQALDMDDCLLMLYDNVEEELEVMVDFNRAGTRMDLIETGVNYDLLRYPTKRQAMDSLQVVLIRTDSENVDPRELEDMRKRGVVTRIFVPLKARDEGIGLLQVDSLNTARFFTHREARMAQALGAQAAISIENARLSTETANQVAQSLVINDLSRAISATMDLNVMIRIVRDQVPLLTDAEDVYLALYDAKTQMITFPMAVHGGREVEMQPRKMGADEVSFVIRNRRPLPLGGEHPSIEEVRRNLGIQNGEGDAKRYLGVPLIAGDLVVGVLAVRDNHESRPFGLNDQRILTTIGTQLGATIQNAQLFTEINERVRVRTLELQQERDRLDALYRITSELVNTMDIYAAIKRALRLVTDTINAEEGVLLLYDPSLQRLYAEAVVTVEVNRDERPKHPADMLGEWLMTQGQPVVVDDLHRVPYWSERVPGAEGWRSAVGAVLGSVEEEKGVLVFLSRELKHFSEAQLKLVVAAANQFASALKDAELYTLIKAQNEQLTESIRSEQEERGKSSAILQSIADGVLVVDQHGRILLINDAAEAILDVPKAFAQEQTLASLAEFYGQSAVNWAATLWTSIAELPQTELKAQRLVLGSKTIDVQFSTVTIGDQSLGTVAVFRDITREMELDRRKSEFIANVSHELRTPLTSIKGYADLIAMGVGGKMNDQQSRFVSTIRDNTERMTTLVDDLLLIAALDTGEEPLKTEPVQLAEVVQRVIERMQQHPEHAEKQLTVNAALNADLPPMDADRVKLTQIVANVIDNAFSYTPAGGQIDISLHLQSNQTHLLLMVRDNGVGIPKEFQERVWNRFERYEQNALVMAVAGTGLGLPITKQYVEMHRGRIWFESEPNKGTTFFIELPLHQPTSTSENLMVITGETKAVKS